MSIDAGKGERREVRAQSVGDVVAEAVKPVEEGGKILIEKSSNEMVMMFVNYHYQMWRMTSDIARMFSENQPIADTYKSLGLHAVDVAFIRKLIDDKQAFALAERYGMGNGFKYTPKKK